MVKLSMQIRPIKTRFFVRLNLFLGLVFLAGFVIILYSVNPFVSGIFPIILFYVALAGLLFCVLNLISMRLKIALWMRILIVIAIIFVLIIKSL
jgi:hypothetical protein